VVGGQERYLACAQRCEKAISTFFRRKELSIVNSPNVKRFYSYVNSKLKTKSGVAPLRNANGELCFTDQEKCELLSAQFASDFTNDNGTRSALPMYTDQILSAVEFEPHVICKELEHLPDKLSRTPDDLPAYFLKRVAVAISEPLAYIFCLSFESGILPIVWKTAYVCPIFKKGSPDSTANYRPVSLTSNVCKTMERIVQACMITFLRQNNLISREQHGFLAKRSTCTQLLETLNDWFRAVNANKCVTALYIDLKSAFTSVVLANLLLKLSKSGITGSLHDWLSAFLTGRTQRVHLNGSFSEMVACTSGVPQGSILGPLLFLLYINDMPSSLKNVSCKLFADDAKIYSIFETNNDVDFLPTAITALEQWCVLNQLTIAVHKCAVLHVGYNNPNRPLMLLGVQMPVVHSIRDLGVVVSDSLLFSEHCSEITRNASKTANLILRALSHSPADVLMRALNVYGRPKLEYCSPVFSPHLVRDVNQIENVQRRFTKRIFWKCNLGDQSYKRRLEVLNAVTLERRRLVFDLTLLYKMLHNLVDLSFLDFFRVFDHRHCTRGSDLNIVSRYVGRLQTDSNFFAIRVVKLWNALPYELKNCATLAIFKNRLKKFQFPPNIYRTKIVDFL